MIIKVSKREGGSSFAKLAKYITEEKREGGERVESVWTDNFAEQEQDAEVAAWKVEAQHKTKKGINKDKTYHLIVSFTPDEAAILKEGDYKAIAQKTAESLNLGGHERICAVHGDTGNPHIHIAINLLDEKNRYKEPYKAFVALKKLRGELSREYGFKELQPVIKDEQQQSDAGAKVKAHGNKASFEDWAKANVTEGIETILKKDSASWAQVHSYLAENGVSLKPRGAGFVVSHNKEKLFIKASSVSRQLSKANLEKTLGKYQIFKTDKEVKAKSEFKTHYIQSKELFAAYQKSLKLKREVRAERRAESKAIFNQEKTELADMSGKAKSEVIEKVTDYKLRVGNLKRLTFERSQKMEEILERNQERNKKIKTDLKHITWKDYLIEEAKGGNLVAVESLQKMNKNEGGLNQVYNDDEWRSVGDTLRSLKARVKDNGELVYQTKKKAEITDRGKRLIIGEKFDAEKIEAALILARAKFGKTLHLSGTSDFQNAVMLKAEEMQVDVNFAGSEKVSKPRVKKSNIKDR